MKADIPAWVIEDEQNGTRCVGFPASRALPKCPGGKLAAHIDYLDRTTGELTVTSVWVTDIYRNPEGELVIWFDPPIYGKVLGVRFYCVPQRKSEQPTPAGTEPTQTNYLEGPTEAMTEYLAANSGDTCDCEDCETC